MLFHVIDEETGRERVSNLPKFTMYSGWWTQVYLPPEPRFFSLYQEMSLRTQWIQDLQNPGLRCIHRTGAFILTTNAVSLRTCPGPHSTKLLGLRLVSHRNPSQPYKEGSWGPGHTQVSSESWAPLGNWMFSGKWHSWNLPGIGVLCRSELWRGQDMLDFG